MLFHYADLHALSLCRLLATTIFLLSWSVASSSTMPLLLTIILSCLHALSLCRPACSFTMQAFFNHNNFFIVMERGKFFYYATFVDNYFVMSACSFTMQTCMLFHYAGFLTTTIFLLSWSVASSSTMPLLLTIILSCLHALSLCRPACSFTMQAFFNHNNFYIVMERGKFVYYATFVGNYFVMSACSFTMQTCMLFNYAGF